jgi:chemotaxis protein MotB
MAEKQPEVKIRFVRKKGGHGGGHSGGAWKIAYADLVTAMMAFFLLMWLLNMTPQEVRAGVAGYMREGQEFFQTEKGQSILEELGKGILPGTRGLQSTGSDEGEGEHDAERQAMEGVKIAIENAFDADKFLSAFKDQISMDYTEEGLRIQFTDQGNNPLFESGSNVMRPFAQSILAEIAKEIAKLNNHIVIGGHTDSIPYMGSGLDNFDLGSSRANSARKIMLAAGMPYTQVSRATGYADRVPLEGHQPNDPQNRRISIVVLSSKFEAMEASRSQSTSQPRGRR